MKTFLLVFVSLIAASSFFLSRGAEPDPVEFTASKLERIILPEAVFKQATLAGAAESLRRQTARFGPPTKYGKAGLMIKVDAAVSGAKFTLHLGIAPAGEVLRYMTALTRSRAEIEADGTIALVPADAKPARDSTPVNYAPPPDPEAEVSLTHKIEQLKLPALELEGATPAEAAEILRDASVKADTAEADPAKKGVSFVALTPPEYVTKAGGITLKVRDVSLREAARAVAEAAGMEVRMDPYAVAFVPVDEDAARKVIAVRLNAIELPALMMREALAEDCIEYLSKKCATIEEAEDRASDWKPIVFSIKGDAADWARTGRLTFTFHKMPTLEALRYIAEMMGTRLELDGEGVAFVSRSSYRGDRSSLAQESLLPVKIREERRKAIVAKLDSLIIPEMVLTHAKMADVLNFLTQKSIELDNSEDTTAKGINIVLLESEPLHKGETGLADVKISMSAKRISFGDAMRAVARLSKATMTIDPCAVVFRPDVDQGK